MTPEMTTSEAHLLRLLNEATGVVEPDDGSRRYEQDEQWEEMTEEERSLSRQLDAYLAKVPTREEQEEARKARLRDYTRLEGGAEAISLALRLDSLTGLRPEAPRR